MTALAPVLTQCHVCRSPLVEQINKRIRDGVPLVAIAAWLRDEGLATFDRNTLSRHKNRHLMSDFERQRRDAADAMRQQQKSLRMKQGDLASLVRDNVYARVEAGELEPTLAEGLRAQQLLDNRAEATKDRDIAVRLAFVLTGGIAAALPAPAPQLGDGAIEGDYEEVDG